MIQTISETQKELYTCVYVQVYVAVVDSVGNWVYRIPADQVHLFSHCQTYNSTNLT